MPRGWLCSPSPIPALCPAWTWSSIISSSAALRPQTPGRPHWCGAHGWGRDVSSCHSLAPCLRLMPWTGQFCRSIGSLPTRNKPVSSEATDSHPFLLPPALKMLLGKGRSGHSRARSPSLVSVCFLPSALSHLPGHECSRSVVRGTWGTEGRVI